MEISFSGNSWLYQVRVTVKAKQDSKDYLEFLIILSPLLSTGLQVYCLESKTSCMIGKCPTNQSVLQASTVIPTGSF